MNHRIARGLAAAAVCTAAAIAQDEVFDHVQLRIASLLPNGDVVIDRGTLDRVRVGDRVVLLPRNGVPVFGGVTEVQDRSAVVAPIDRTAVLPRGARGEVLVPKSRRGPEAAPREEPVRPADPGTPATPPEDDGWRPGMPLLAGTRPLRPEERSRTATGRIYTIADLVHTNGSGSDSLLRTGADVDVGNPFGQGGALRFHGDLGAATEWDGAVDAEVRLYELSYTLGGTRYAPQRWEFGRFLPHDMPEFGRLDGVAWSHRSETGMHVGASIGYLPAVDDDLATGDDFQLAAWFLSADAYDARCTWGIGYQKTWHHADADRDLVVGKVRYLGDDGYDFAATAWIDLYTAGDTRREGADPTRVLAHTGRRWSDGARIDLAYDHERYPDVERLEQPQVLLPATLLGLHQDRLTLHAETAERDGTRWFTRLAGWIDEARTGGSAEGGVTIADLLAADTRSGAALFVVEGRSESMFGARLEHGGAFANGRLDLLAEMALVHFEGFPAGRNDLVQYRVGALWTAEFVELWSATLHADSTLWDQELSFGLGFYLQRRF